MKLSDRLQACADLVVRGNIVADIGTDHGFLPVWLLQHQVCPEVIAADLREKPLQKARLHAERAGMAQRMTFCLSDGLQRVPVERVQTIICAGMGGDLIAEILDRARCVWTPDKQFILQPQSSVGDLRGWLFRHGFRILSEHFAADAGFVYTVMDVRYAGASAAFEPSAAACILPQGDTVRRGELYHSYLQRVLSGVEKTAAGLSRAASPDEKKRSYYTAALEALRQAERETAE